MVLDQMHCVKLPNCLIKMNELIAILNWMQTQFPDLQATFHDGKDEKGKQITNPTHGFGAFEQTYANGEKKTHFQIGVAQTKSGISIYLLGIRGKMDLPAACSALGKAKVTGYCISYKKMTDLNLGVLKNVLLSTLKLFN